MRSKLFGGLFTRQDARDVEKKTIRRRNKQVSAETLQKLGVAGTAQMNPQALNPNMQPVGKGDIYVLGEKPSVEADRQGVPFNDDGGEWLWQAIPKWAKKRVVTDYVVRTLPPNLRKPKREEVECFRKEVEASILQHRPTSIIAVGGLAVSWFYPKIKKIKVARGRRFPAQIEDHKFFVFPVTPPEWLMEVEDRREDSVPGKEWIKAFERDIRRACDQVMDEEEPRIVGLDEAWAGVEPLIDVPVGDVLRFIERMGEEEETGNDIETTGIRPYNGAYVLSVGISSGVESKAFGVDHPSCCWSKKDRGMIIDALGEYLSSEDGVRVFQNAPFDLEHLVELCGEGILRGSYGDYMQASFALDPGPPERLQTKEGAVFGPGHLSLDFMCTEDFGLPLKGLNPEVEALIKKGRAEEVALAWNLPYCALDAKWALLGWRERMARVIGRPVEKAYQMQMRRIPPVVIAQRRGMLVNADLNASLEKELEAGLVSHREKLKGMPEVQEYERRFGEFDPGKPAQVGKLIAEVIGDASVRGKTKNQWKTDKLILAEVNSPVIAPILRFREDRKLKGTYVDRFCQGHEKSLVYPDGRVHCQLGIAKTRTGRLQSEAPNGQNWPARRFAHVRAQLCARPGHWYLAVDQGGAEARMLACESCDPVWVESLWDGTDVHAVWAEKVIKRYPIWMEKSVRGQDGKKLPMKKVMEACRYRAKNGLVFPLFYGSSSRSVANNQDWPDDVAGDIVGEFFSDAWFSGIKRWQQRKWRSYQSDHMVRSLTGRQRLAPLSWNQVINTPIQADASDVEVDAWERLYWQSVEEEKPWLAAILMVHDELLFEVPDAHLDEAIEDVVMASLGYKADWLNVPLSVDAEIGRDFFNMEKIGTFRSDKFVV